MKTPTPRFRKKIRRIVSVFLCCILAVGCLALPAFSAEPDQPDAPESSSVTGDESGAPAEDTDGDSGDGETPPPGYREGTVYFHMGEFGTITEVLNTADRPEVDQPDIPEKEGYISAGWYIDDDDDLHLELAGPVAISLIPEKTGELHLYARWKAIADLDPVVVTFDFGSFGTVEQTVDAGQCPEHLPEIPEADAWRGYAVQCWLDDAGQEVDPTQLPVLWPTTYTAKLVRSVSALLNTDEHKSYLNGSGGLLRPLEDISRAEAATMFSNLLRTKDFPKANNFRDVDPGQWYAEAVSQISTLRIAGGYSDGTFQPSRKITRAEFVKMASSCGSLQDAPCPFVDVSGWAKPYVASAYAKGWISMNSTKTFRPEDYITRAEAVKIINLMLGRKADPDVKKKSGVRNFADVFPDHWSYPYIIEASTSHDYVVSEDNKEYWTEHTHYGPAAKPGWLKSGGKTYYVGKDGKCLRGEQTIDGEKYIFDSATGAATSGFFMVNGWKRYYKDGRMMEDISNLGVVSGPYFIKVYKPANYLIIFAKGSDGKYNIPVRSMLVSCGEPTPTGDFYTPDRYRWLEMVGGSWAQWCTQIMGSYLFHSVPNNLRTNDTMWVNEYNNLGTTRSLGCIRLNCEDAKWIYDNCALGTHVNISPTETSGPLPKPAGLKLPAGHTWDPTDPTAYYLCKQRGCH